MTSPMSDTEDHPRRRRSDSPRSDYSRSRSRSPPDYKRRGSDARGRSPVARRDKNNNGGDKPYRLIVNNLSFDCSWSDLKDYMKKVAPVQYADVRRYPDGKSKGYGVVDFEVPEDAEKAMQQLQGANFLGREINLRFGEEERKSTKEADGLKGNDGNFHAIFAANLPYSVKWWDLKDLFAECGSVKRADVAEDDRGRSKGFGSVVFETAEDVEKAIEKFNGYEWKERKIEVRADRFGVPINNRPPRRRRSRSRSRSRSRRRYRDSSRDRGYRRRSRSRSYGRSSRRGRSRSYDRDHRRNRSRSYDRDYRRKSRTSPNRRDYSPGDSKKSRKDDYDRRKSPSPSYKSGW